MTEAVDRASGREWWVLAVASAAMVFATGTTFSSLGVVVFAMSGQFAWSAGDAGAAFTLLIVACCIAQMLPVIAIRRIGGRGAMVFGFALFAIADLIGAFTDGLAMLYLAIVLAAAGFALVSNATGIYLIAGWSRARAPQMIGLYLMLGTLGSALGPPLAQALVASTAGWPAFWFAMSGAAAILAIACALAIREPPVVANRIDAGGDARSWTFAANFMSPRFLVPAAAMVATQLCVMTISSVAPAHLVGHGWSAGFAARLLGFQGLIGALGTGASGFLAGRLSPRTTLVAALLLQAVGVLLLAGGSAGWALALFVPCFGIGWSVTSLAVTLLLVEDYGHAGGSTTLAVVWALTGASAIGPWTAGLLADAGWGYGGTLTLLGVLLAPVALAAFLNGRRRPVTELA